MTRTLMILILAAGMACTMPATSGPLRDREWTLSWVEGFDSFPVRDAATPTIRFGSDGRLSANTGCNSAGATYTADNGRLTMGDMMLTKRACIDTPGNQVESAFVRAIGATRSYRVANDQLELLDGDGGVVARFH